MIPFCFFFPPLVFFFFLTTSKSVISSTAQNPCSRKGFYMRSSEDLLSLSLRGSAGKESTCNVGDLGLIPGLGRSPGEGNSYSSLQYSGLKNCMDSVVQGVTKSWT